MTRYEAAVVTAYTGKLIGSVGDFQRYIEQKLGRPVMLHELSSLEDEIRAAAKVDFDAIGQHTADFAEPWEAANG